MERIKVFMAGISPTDQNAENLTQKILDWQESSNAIIRNIHSNSNDYGWMIVVTYQINKGPSIPKEFENKI